MSFSLVDEGKVAREQPSPRDADAADALHEITARTDVLMDLMPQMVWSTRPDGFHDYYNARWYEFTGVPRGSTDGEAWNGMFHADDQERAFARWQHSLATGKPYEIEYRLRHNSGDYRWTLGRALPIRDADGRITRWIGTCTDIDEQKRGVDQLETISRELSHRIKNIFAVVSGLIGLSARNHPEAKLFAEDLRGRVAALGRAHEFVRPHSEQSRPETGEVSLHTMLRDLLAPYPALDEGRLVVAGDDMRIDDRGATPIALVFHELATNAAKYGALSSPDGQIRLETSVDVDAVRMSWTETGGPAVAGLPTHQGFGTRLADMSIAQQLGGEIRRDWPATGLRVDMTVPLGRFVRS